MVVREYHIKIKKGATVRIWPIGDIHAGTVACVEDEIRKCVQRIKEDPLSWWIGMGDYAECIVPTDPRWEPSQHIISSWVRADNVAESEREMVHDLLDPIKDKCIGLLYGNHEDKIRKRSFYDMHSNLCKNLGAFNLGFSCFVHIIIESSSTSHYLVKGYFTHGSGGAATKQGKIKKLVDVMTTKQADIYGYGHVHDVLPVRYKMLTTSNKTLRLYERRFLGFTTGSWLHTYIETPISTYGESANYGPVTTGCPIYLIKDGRLNSEIYEV